MKTTILVGIAVLMMLVSGCGQDSKPTIEEGSFVIPSQTQPDQPQVEETTPPQDNRLCGEVLKCEQRCFDLFPFVDEQDIRRDCSARGIGAFSGACQKAVNRNLELIDSYNACLELPIGDVL